MHHLRVPGWTPILVTKSFEIGKCCILYPTLFGEGISGSHERQSPTQRQFFSFCWRVPFIKEKKKWVGQWYQNKSWSVEAPIPLAIWSFDLDPCRYRWEIHWSVFQSLDWFKGNVTGKPWKTLYFMGKPMVSGSDFPANPLISIDPMLPSCSHSVGSWLDLSREALPLETVAIHLKNEWLNHVNTTKWGRCHPMGCPKRIGEFPMNNRDGEPTSVQLIYKYVYIYMYIIIYI